MAGKVGCALLLAVLFAAAAVSRTSFAVFLASLEVLLGLGGLRQRRRRLPPQRQGRLRKEPTPLQV